MVRLADSMYPSSPLKWLYVDFNSYFASVEQQLQPALRGKPVAVVPVETDSTCAIAASYEAKAFGVKTGTPIWEARQKCPELICVLARHEAYVDYHHRAIAEINRHIPVSAVCSIDEMASELMRNEASPDVARRIGLAIKTGLAANLGPWVRCSIGIAENRYLAKVATDLEKPDGLTILMPDEVKGRLMALDLRDLPGIGRNMERRLQMAGISSMADLWALDRRTMRSVWGSIWGERMWYLLRGYDLPELETKRSSLGHSHVLGPALRPPHLAIDVARRLTMKACSRLRRMGYCATVFGFSARLEDGRRIHAESRCRPAQDSMTFLDMLLVFWEQMIPKDRDVQVKKLSVVLHGLVQQDLVQLDLFDVFDPEPLVRPKKRDSARMNGLSHALDRINHRFGRDSALIGMLPSQGRSFSGTKIAFTRIPDVEEFLE
jgi:DNA polymerase IV